MSKKGKVPKSKSRGFEESPQFSLFQQPPKIGNDFARSNSIYKLNLLDSGLFGIDDAAYEQFDLLQSYSIKRLDCKGFYDPNIPFFAVRAPKGTGKTTMVRLLERDLSHINKVTTILKYDAQISPSLNKDASLADWIVAWKKKIAEAVLLELSEQQKMVFDPDMIGVVERAEERGERKQNFVGLFRDSFSLPKVKGRPDHTKKNQQAILERLASKTDHLIWVFLDEVDQSFTNENQSIYKVAAMFLAARELTGYIDNLIIRITIKPNVFAIIENCIDSISNLREFVVDLTWNKGLIRAMLAKRVESYLDRNVKVRFDENLLHGESDIERGEWLISQLFFTQEFDLGKGNRPPHEILGLLANYRPRWVLSLCKISAKIAFKKKYELVHFAHVSEALYDFGLNTMTDLCSEYKSQCKDLDKVIHRFHGAPTRFLSYAHLLGYIEALITKRLDVQIIGIADKASPSEIASFLYQIGFIDARKDISNKKQRFVRSTERPELIDSQFNDEFDDFYWEILPTFRDHLDVGRAPNSQVPGNRGNKAQVRSRSKSQRKLKKATGARRQRRRKRR